MIHQLVLMLADSCNLRCNDCGQGSPLLRGPNMPSLDGFGDSLAILSGVLQAGQITFTGGEPLLNKNICAFMRAGRQSGMFRRVVVYTNGVLLPRMSEEFWRLVDVVEISIYPATRKTLSEAHLQSLEETASRFGTKLVLKNLTEFYKAFSEERIDDSQEVQRTFSTCREAHEDACHTLYKERFYRCSRVHMLDRYLSQIGVEHESFADEDGVLIDARDTLRDELASYLASTQPLKACRYCHGTSGPRSAHRQLTVEEIRAKWKKSGPDSATDTQDRSTAAISHE